MAILRATIPLLGCMLAAQGVIAHADPLLELPPSASALSIVLLQSSIPAGPRESHYEKAAGRSSVTHPQLDFTRGADRVVRILLPESEVHVQLGRELNLRCGVVAQSEREQSPELALSFVLQFRFH